MSGSLTRFLAHPAALVLHNNSALKSLCLTVIIEPLIKICTHPIWNQGEARWISDIMGSSRIPNKSSFLCFISKSRHEFLEKDRLN